jgi:hypothetical protein
MSNAKDKVLMEGEITDPVTVRILRAYFEALGGRDPEAVNIRELLPAMYEALPEVTPLSEERISALERKAKQLIPKERLQVFKHLIGWRDNA